MGVVRFVRALVLATASSLLLAGPLSAANVSGPQGTAPIDARVSAELRLKGQTTAWVESTSCAAAPATTP